MRKKAPGARDIFLGMERVNLVFGFVTFVGNRKDADAMDGRSGRAERGNGDADVIPGEIDAVDNHNKSEENCDQAHEKAHGGRGLGLRRHEDLMEEYFASHEVV